MPDFAFQPVAELRSIVSRKQLLQHLLSCINSIPGNCCLLFLFAVLLYR